VKCNEKSFNKYINSLGQHHALAKDIGTHLKTAIISLV
jgi:hypothetical protein